MCNGRNNILWNEKSSSTQDLVNVGLQMLRNWQGAKRSLDLSNSSQGEFWCVKPFVGRLKCNVDAAIHERVRCVSFVAVLQDEDGGFSTGLSRFTMHLVPPYLAKAMALHTTL